MNTLAGHERIMGLLGRMAVEGKTAHAYIFSGRDGIGKKIAAVRFACLLNCSDPAADPEHSCPSCRKILREAHPDVTVEKPERGMIRIDRIRNLQSFFRYAPVEGRYRITVIDDAHLMNHQAQNALLKTLEEPPPGRILILVTSKPFQLLPTVRSRCRRVRFAPLAHEAVARFLETQRGLEPEKAAALAAMACGSVARALEMENTTYFQLREQVLSVLERPGSLGVRGLLSLSQKIAGDRETAVHAIEVASTWVRDLLIAKSCPDQAALIHRDLLDRTVSTAQHQSSDVWLAVYDELTKASDLLGAETNINSNMLLDVAFLRISRLLAGPTLGVASANH